LALLVLCAKSVGRSARGESGFAFYVASQSDELIEKPQPPRVKMFESVWRARGERNGSTATRTESKQEEEEEKMIRLVGQVRAPTLPFLSLSLSSLRCE